MASIKQSYVEATFVSDLKKSIDKKLKPLTANEQVKYELAKRYLEYANMYVPRSDDKKSKHLQDSANVETRGRIRWYKRNSKGKPITDALYWGKFLIGKQYYHRRASGATSVGSHRVHAKEGRWDYFVKHTKTQWKAFCRDAKAIIKRYL